MLICKNENKEYRVKVTQREEKGVTLLSVCAQDATCFDAQAGLCIEMQPSEKVVRFMAIRRISEYWCAPVFGEDIKDIPPQTQTVVLEYADGRFCAIVPTVNDEWKCELYGTKNGIAAHLFSWCEGKKDCKGLFLCYAVGDRASRLIKQCVEAALEALGRATMHRQKREYPEIFEYLGWCTWDSMQIRVNEEGILQKCEEFRQKEIPVKWAIFDDMWAEIHNFYGAKYDSFKEMIHMMRSSPLYDFEADPRRFPQGLAKTIQKVKEYGMQVGMWIPTTGYWHGIEENSPAYQKLQPFLQRAENGMWIPDWKKEKSYGYYHTILSFFKKCGAAFVKIDNQSMTRRYYKGQAAVGRVAREFHDGMERAVKEEFDSAMINCMGTASEDVWNRSLSPITRCSDDFKPEDAAWFAKHVLQCAYSSLFLGEFYWCDWDMWWTDDGQAEKNSLMRAISGGPVYVSDMIGRSRAEVLEPLCLSDGKILRCDRPALPTADCVTVDPTKSGKALKLQNMAGEHGILAVLNLDAEEKAVQAVLRAEDIDGFTAEEFAVYEHFSGSFFTMKNGEEREITLQSKEGYRLYIFAPIKDGFAVIGRTDKFISPKTVRAVRGRKVELIEDGPYAVWQDGELIVK